MLTKRPTAILVLLAALVMTAAAPGRTQAREGGGTEVVEGLHSELLGVMKSAGELGFCGRYDRLEPVIRGSFDLPYIARLSLGGWWEDLTEAEREELVGEFTRLSVATYASRFDGYSGEVFRTVSVRPPRGGRMVVRSALQKADGEAIDFVYLLHLAGGEWKIVNVVVNGVSDLSLKRSQFTSIMKAEGFTGLLERIDEKVREHAGEG